MAYTSGSSPEARTRGGVTRNNFPRAVVWTPVVDTTPSLVPSFGIPYYGKENAMTLIEVPTPAYPLTDMQEIIFRQFWLVGNFTDSELNAYYSSVWHRFGWPQVRHDTPRKRRSELAALGLLVDSGMKRPNGFGSDERVWKIAEVER